MVGQKVCLQLLAYVCQIALSGDTNLPSLQTISISISQISTSRLETMSLGCLCPFESFGIPSVTNCTHIVIQRYTFTGDQKRHLSKAANGIRSELGSYDLRSVFRSLQRAARAGKVLDWGNHPELAAMTEYRRSVQEVRLTTVKKEV